MADKVLELFSDLLHQGDFARGPLLFLLSWSLVLFFLLLLLCQINEVQ
jgi:hypothetical protein